MTSSAYYTSHESAYWPAYNQSMLDASAYQASSGYFQHPYHHVPLLQHQHQQQPHSPPQMLKPIKQEAPSSLLETLLRHGKEAVADKYGTCVTVTTAAKSTTTAAAAAVVAVVQQQQPSVEPVAPEMSPYAQCQTPPYTPSSSSDRTSPGMTGVLGDSGSQDRFPPAALGYSGQGYAYGQQQSAGYAGMHGPTSPGAGYDACTGGAGYAAAGAYGNNNNSVKSEHTQEECEFGEEQQALQVDYPWMKSHYANGECGLRFFFFL